MKPQIALFPEQMQRLHTLGLDCSDASMAWLAPKDNMIDETLTTLEYAKKQSDRWAYTPAYTLEDIICKINAEVSYNSSMAKPIRQRAGGYRPPRPWNCSVVIGEDLFLEFDETPLGAAYFLLKEIIHSFPDKIKKLER